MIDAKPQTPPNTNEMASNTPENEAANRIKTLQSTIKNLEAELKMNLGRFKNRDPEALNEIKNENILLKARLDKLCNVLFLLTSEFNRPRQVTEIQNQSDTLRQGAIEFYKRSNVDPEIWKNTVF